jgi:hypothetical protein
MTDVHPAELAAAVDLVADLGLLVAQEIPDDRHEALLVASLGLGSAAG